ncbi:hypothetical protein OESDEN_04167 [Oesophagostomum dentatum]|uniref:BACK domain-containing protein n=1 Tax=Oesophagostomum dentatum TaxID=61180 RepID=A0A0B1TID9_OESDE|nr:hypothetical protein OESDEN_04167 [Oesophagostomum dentatum]
MLPVTNTIKLIYKKGHRYVKIADFVAVSQLIKQHQVTGRVPRSIDLTDYFDSTITIFADYIEKGEVKILILTAESSTDHLIQAVLVAGTSNITKETENALHYLAAWSFVEMAKLPDFQRIPYHQFVILLASCELHVSHELVAADAALLWLVGQPHPAVYVPGVFSVIRSAYLTKVDRQLIIERIATLQMPESVARFARICMESRHSLRICLEGSHINRHLCRCGIPDPETRPKETALSLSRPREGIKWSEKTWKGSQQKVVKKQSERRFEQAQILEKQEVKEVSAKWYSIVQAPFGTNLIEGPCRPSFTYMDNDNGQCCLSVKEAIYKLRCKMKMSQKDRVGDDVRSEVMSRERNVADQAPRKAEGVREAEKMAEAQGEGEVILGVTKAVVAREALRKRVILGRIDQRRKEEIDRRRKEDQSRRKNPHKLR